MEKDDFREELDYFNKVEGIIRGKLEKLYDDRLSLRERVLRERKELWDENRHGIADFDDVILLSSQDRDVSWAENQYERNEQEIQRLKKMEKSPYFGRLDFEEYETGETRTIYIGTSGLSQDETHEICVVDWRAPIASMFYQFDLGPAWYEFRDYREDVEITRKRQYRIEDGRLLRAYDTDSSMYDDILGEVLSGHSDHKLKVIAGSIQKEQNLAIRSDPRRPCLIYGLAGSGKTSIGLHRLAYVLYLGRNTLKSENVLVLSNNNIFGSYISTILPDLGERPPRQMVFADFLDLFLGKEITVEDFYRQLKLVDSCPSHGRIAWIRLTCSADFLQYCIDYFAAFPFQVPEIRYHGRNILSPEVILRKLESGSGPSFQSRCDRLGYLVRQGIEGFFELHKEEIYHDLEEEGQNFLMIQELKLLYQKKKAAYLQRAQEEIIRANGLYSEIQAVKVLSGYLRQAGMDAEEATRLKEALERGNLFYEDALFYLLIKVLMGEAAPFLDIRHTVIDESQDYNLLQLYIVKYLLPKSNFTLLGDICQTVNPITTMQKYEDYEKIFGPGLIRIRLDKCYRSSADINALAFALLGETDHPEAEGYSYFMRRVKKPQYFISQDMVSCIPPILEGLKEYHSIAVIVNSDEEAFRVKSKLQKYETQQGYESQLIVSPDDEIKGRLVIIPLLLAKGLEFDAVILFGCVQANEANDHLRRKIYLGCTRALHELYLIENGPLPDSLRECEDYMEIVTSGT